MAIVGLVRLGLVKLVISQNVDGLHLRSGLPRDKLAELHGNLFLETCEVCGCEYLRDFDVGGISFNKTGRTCTRAGCGGALRDTLLDWDDALPEADLFKAETALGDCDLCICMGTSLRIKPASELPLISVRSGGKLVICNLQNTPKDRHATLNIHAPVDEILSGAMALLGHQIPNFRREIQLCTRAMSIGNGSDDVEVSVFGIAGETCALPVVEKCWAEDREGKREGLQGPPWKTVVGMSAGEVKVVLSLAAQHARGHEELLRISLDGLSHGGKAEQAWSIHAPEVCYEVQRRHAPQLAQHLVAAAKSWADSRPLRAAAAGSGAGGEGNKVTRKRRGACEGEEEGGRGWVQCENKGCLRWGRPRAPLTGRHAPSPDGLQPAVPPFYCRRRCEAEAEAVRQSLLMSGRGGHDGEHALVKREEGTNGEVKGEEGREGTWAGAGGVV